MPVADLVDPSWGMGASGPWAKRPEVVAGLRRQNPARVDAWLNQTYSVQLFRHAPLPGIDHLVVRRHDEGTDIPWTHMQAIKDRLADNGHNRWAIEVFPPCGEVIDNCNIRHIWVMPQGWTSPVDLHTPGVHV
jgi:hypothetical protein